MIKDIKTVSPQSRYDATSKQRSRKNIRGIFQKSCPVSRNGNFRHLWSVKYQFDEQYHQYFQALQNINQAESSSEIRIIIIARININDIKFMDKF